jgi:uncharacterized protein (DUF58 family)
MKPESHNSKVKIKKSFIEKTIGKLAPNLMLHKRPEGLPLQINWRRIFILPTKPGLFFSFIAFLMLVASLNFNNNMGLMMTFLLVGLAQVALYKVFFNIRNLTIQRVTAQPIFLGEKAIYTIFLTTTETKYDICVQNISNKDCLIELPADKTRQVTCQLETVDRGWLICGKIKVLSSYPFGLFYAWIWTNLEAKCLVYPAPELNPPDLPRDSQSEGKTTVITHGEDFHGLKPFNSGDPMRLIAWKKTAQTGELISREFQQTQGEKLLLDFSHIQLADTELKLSRLTAWVLISYQQQLDFCLKLPTFNSGYGYSTEHYLNCLKALALFGKK